MERYLTSVGDTLSNQTGSPSRQKICAKKRIKTKPGENRASSKRKSLQILQPSAQHQRLLVGIDGVITQSNKTKKSSGKRKIIGDVNDDRPRKLSRSNEELIENETATSVNKCKESKVKSNTSSRVNRKGGSKKVERSDGQKTFAIFEDPSTASSDDTDQEKKTKTAEEEAYELMVQEPVTDSYWKQLAEQRREALDDSLRENEQLHDEVAELKEENDRLKIMADQAEYLATVVQELMGDEDADTDKTLENGEASQQSDTSKSQETQHKGSDIKQTQSISEESDMSIRDGENNTSDDSDL